MDLNYESLFKPGKRFLPEGGADERNISGYMIRLSVRQKQPVKIGAMLKELVTCFKCWERHLIEKLFLPWGTLENEMISFTANF